MLTKTLTRQGNSLSLVIDKPILDLFNIDEKTKLNIVADDHGLHILPATTTQSRQKKILALLKRSHKRYEETYLALSRPE